MMCIDNSSNFELNIKGTDSGTLDYEIRSFNENDNLKEARFAVDVPVTKDTVITATTDFDENTVLLIDNDGDGNFEDSRVLKMTFAKGHILGNPDSVTIFDALEILKYLVGMDGAIKKGDTYAEKAFNSALITQDSLEKETPTIFDALEILKHLVGMPSKVVN